MVAMVLASVSGNHSLGGGGKSTCSNTEIYCTILIQALQEQTCQQQRWWKKAKITLNISVGYNCQEWLINRAVHLWETCSIKSVGQCVCQQIALVYFPWCLSPSPYPTCLISCPAWLHWCVSVITSGVLSVSDSREGRGWTHATCDLCPLPPWPRMTLI